MSLSIYFEKDGEDDAPSEHLNITHNLGKMANQVILVQADVFVSGLTLYDVLWRGDEHLPSATAKHYIEHLCDGLHHLASNREYYSKFNPENGWGDYDGLLKFITGFIIECSKYPDYKVYHCR